MHIKALAATSAADRNLQADSDYIEEEQKMDEKKWLDRIGKSADDISVPESLSPENIQKMLEEKSMRDQAQEKCERETNVVSEAFAKKKRRRYLLRTLEAAAAVVLVFAVGHRVGVTQGMTDGRGEAVLVAETETEQEKENHSVSVRTVEKMEAETERMSAVETAEDRTEERAISREDRENCSCCII